MAKLKHGVLAALVLVVTSVVVSSATSAPAAPPSSPSPDTHKSIPDFWAVLSASVVTKGTLGIGSDLALTAGASNNQVLTVTALERASGCLVQGVWVELYDPKGKAVPRARVQTQQGLGYLGGLKLEDAGLYHLWIYAKDAGGKVVSEGYLPIQVKDRGKTPFETVNGRYFTTSDGATWTESTPPTRGTASVSGGNPFAAFAAAFQQLVTGIANSILGTKPKADAAKAVAVLKDPKLSVQERVLTVKSKWDIHPAFLVTTPSAQPADPHPAAVSGEKMKLVSHDGGSLVSHDGGSLVSQDGGTLIAGGGNLIASEGAGNGRSLQSATATIPSGSCANGYKTVGAGKTVTVGGSPVLAGNNGQLAEGTYVISGKNEMPVNGYVDGKATATATASGETLNIVMNGGAESGSAASDDHGVVAPANWTATGNFTAVKYGSSGFPDAAASASVHGGTNLFVGGPDNSESSATQKDEIPADWVSAVSGGHVTATLSASLGGYENQPDATTVRYQFLDGSGATLLDATIGPVAPSQRQNITGLKAVSKVVTVPAGTRSVQITISAIRGIGAYNDGSADNVALTLGR